LYGGRKITVFILFCKKISSIYGKNSLLTQSCKVSVVNVEGPKMIMISWKAAAIKVGNSILLSKYGVVIKYYSISQKKLI